ncbi:hypothetical protein R1sor_007995 [Riccia sorocarpa]|uniref:Uncharacterized protein n=1 Tax=Riccia sorocarpa TaxID=122646 RepID=A0ABD3HUE2_9MARC
MCGRKSEQTYQVFGWHGDAARSHLIATLILMHTLVDISISHKQRTFCEKMIMNLSSEGDIVLDFFSGGVFTREAFLKGRDVVYFANSSFESEFITKYSKALCKFNQRIHDWFVRFGQGKKPAASTPVAATVGDYHASSSDVNVASLVVDDQLTNDAWHRLGMAQRRVVAYEPYVEDDS